jgi:hypothetical protein
LVCLVYLVYLVCLDKERERLNARNARKEHERETLNARKARKEERLSGFSGFSR